ncbi:TfuA-like protein [Streptomyces aureoverticillatus]|uniref:TfuA-like protein n=1 Tax=Streptomyces aureoverticillatus TaxID=66871 RepID=UPI0013DB8331|nr:TfuA-like protein [Streptomyces aureoverticillatus]QIB49541.1 hypothetical protein G3H79_40960 [Streptomyces aureoverticillatus]
MIHVYVGPTLGPDEPALAAPRIRLRPPLRHGDLFDPVIGDRDTVVVLDGVWHQAPAARHKELLALLARGVRVIGAASLGAVRAAELHAFGMAGIGAVFRAYRRGEIEGDDEVAVGQDPASLRALTWPLVNLRHVLKLAAHEDVVSAEKAAALLAELRTVFYPQRTLNAVLATCRTHGVQDFADWFVGQRAADPFFGDLKRSDALEAVQVAQEVELPRPRPRVVWQTGYYRRWADDFAVQSVEGQELPTRKRLAYQQFFDPTFSQVWAAFLQRLSARTADGPGMLLAERVKATGAGLPSHVLFRPVPDLRDAEVVARLLARETGADRAALVRYLEHEERARSTVRGFSSEAVDDTVTHCTLLRLWASDGEGLQEAARARGFGSAVQAVQELKPFMPGLLADQQQQRGERGELADVR